MRAHPAQRNVFVSSSIAVLIAFTLMAVLTPGCEDDTGALPFTLDAGIQLDTGSPQQQQQPPPPPPVDSGTPVVDSSAPLDATPDADVDAAKPPGCDDGTVDPGEICDPLASCPTKCTANGCQLRTLQNAGTCTASCVNGAIQSACANGDGCCPVGGPCNSTNDDDCAATCNNGVIEGTEICDPLSSCPQNCPAIGCQMRTLENGGTCGAKCVNGGTITACINNDGCCNPALCNANNDSDCGPGCGNNVVEAGETCDPLTTCPTKCPQLACQIQTLQNAGTCKAECVTTGLQISCINNDGCCPGGCNANNDNDCTAKCPNGVVEPGETCDPTAPGGCPTSCPQVVCQKYKLDKPGTCQAACIDDGIQTACVNGDGCCPNGCNANTDSDCTPKCGNSVVEPGETCDPPASCPKCSESYTCYSSKGKPSTCDVVCHIPITNVCGPDGDNCCPYNKNTDGCSTATDKECAGSSWKWVKIRDVDTTKGCTAFNVTNILPGSSYDFTTCAPPGQSTGSGDPSITSIIDVQGLPYPVANDNCTDQTALPWLTGSTCTNKAGNLTMACASPSPGGFRANAGAGPTQVQVTVCPVGGAGAGGGTTPLFVWYNAPSNPK